MGNYGCGCSDVLKESINIENTQLSSLEEVIEFQPYLQEYTKNKKPILISIDESSIFSDYPRTEVFGELWRVQKSSKEILIPRWCVLGPKTFKYYKNQYSAYCNDKPLFEISTEKIIKSRGFIKQDKFFIEFECCKNNFTNLKQKITNPSRPFIKISSKRESLSSSNSTKLSINEFASGNNAEILLFSAADREEWEKWSKALSVFIKTNNLLS